MCSGRAAPTPAARLLGDAMAETTRTPSAKGRRARRKRSARRPLWLRILRWAALIVIVLIVIPLVLTPLYRVVAPVSMPMIWHRLTGDAVRRDWIPLDAVSPTLIRAVIAAEDNFFCAHHGVDLGALREVIAAGGDRGASTIAMQTARNLFLWQGRSYVRKALEIPLALYADLVLGKRRLLEIYLNIAEWGPGIFGIAAAAQYHFGVAASELGLTQSSLLAATLPNPIERNPANPSPSLAQTAATIAGRVADGPNVACLGL
jgi:monofunctional biosynthetic peptidoglycan transglycosylase